MSLMSMFPGGGGTNNQPLKAPTNLNVTMNTLTSVQIRWTDPENEYSQPSGALIGEWMFTRIVRKAGSAPVNANDGEMIVESAVKNQYKTNPFIDDTNTLVTGTRYYYAAFAFTKTRVSSPAAVFELLAAWYDPILNNNSWTLIHQAFEEGVAASLWSKGDTKSDSNGWAYTLEALNPRNFTLAEGGYPHAIFLKSKMIETDQVYSNERIHSYRDSALKTRLTSYYNSKLSDELKTFIHPMNFRLDYTDDLNNVVSTPETISDYLFPPGQHFINTFLPTDWDKEQRGEGWWTGDVGQNVRYGDFRNSAIYWELDSAQEGRFWTRPQNSTMNVLFGFAFGKAGG